MIHLKGFEIDHELNRELLKLEQDAPRLMPGGPHKPQTKGKYFRALAEAWEAGKLLAVSEVRPTQKERSDAD